MKASEALRDILSRMKALGEQQDARWKQIEERIKAVEAAAARSTTPMLPNGVRATVNVPGVGIDDPGAFSFVRAVRGIITGKWDEVGAGYEKEVFQEAREVWATTEVGRKAASLANDETLGFLVPSQVIAEIIPLLRSKLILEQLGVTFLDDLVGSPVEIARETGGGTGYWVGENSDITESDQKVDMMRLRPHKAGILTKISNTLIRTGGPRVESFVRNSITQTLARTIQTAFFNGTGADGQPLGVLNADNILATDHSSAAITLIALQQMVEDIEFNNGDTGTMGWAMNPRLKGSIHQLVRHHGGAAGNATDPLFFPGAPTQGLPSTILGIPVMTTTDLPLVAGDGDIVLAVWAETILGNWGMMELAASTETGDAFKQDQTWLRALQEVDVGVRQPKSINVLQNVAA